MGDIGDVGVVQDTMGGNETVIGGTLPQRIQSCLSALDKFLNQSHPVVASNVLPDKTKASGGIGNTDLLRTMAHILGNLLYLL